MRLMSPPRLRTVPLLVAGVALLMLGAADPGSAQAQKASKEAPKEAPKDKSAKKKGTPFAGFGSNSKEPIKIDANKLEVFDKENRAVYSGDVVLVQGQTTLRSTTMTVYYISTKNNGETKGGPDVKTSGAAKAGPGQNSIRKIDFTGPVSILSGTQSAISKFMTYDALVETVTLTGSVVISDCENVQRGERAVYDIKTGKATVDAGAKGRVQGIFTPGSDDKKKSGNGCGGKT
jgi:lipopolysaccharide export system protein LptA